jgi:hypothetical protein
MQRFARILLCVACGACFATIASADVTIRLPTPPVPIIVPEPPLFLLPPALGFRVAVDTPHDLYEIDKRFYVFKQNAWYAGPRYNGPWQPIRFEQLPPGLRKHRAGEIRRERDREYEHYRKEGKGYRGKPYRPEHYDEHDHQDRDRHKERKNKHDRDDDRDDRDRDDDHGKHGKKGRGGHDH